LIFFFEDLKPQDTGWRKSGKTINPLISIPMKNLTPSFVALAATMFTSSLFAQEAALASAQTDAVANPFDCVRTVATSDRTLGFEGGVVTQTFKACTNGALQNVSLNVKNASPGAAFLVELRDDRGEVLDLTRFTQADIKESTVSLNLSAPVKQGATYALMISAPESYPLALRYLQGPAGSLFKEGDPVRGELSATFGFKSHDLVEADEAVDFGRAGEAAPQNRGMEGQCKVDVNGHNGRFRLTTTGHNVTQTFSACSRGVLDMISVKVQGSFGDFTGRFFVRTADGSQTLYAQEISARNIENGELIIPMEVRVEAGETYMFGIKTIRDRRISLYNNSDDRVGTCRLNGAPQEANVEFTAYIAESNDVEAREELMDTKVITYPNPFADRLNIRLEGAKEEKAIVQLLDFSGNVLRSEIVNVKDHQGQVTFNTREIMRPGYYALRVIQGTEVKNITVMKR